MDKLKAGAKYEFNFGGIDFSKGVKVFEINYSDTVGGVSGNLLAGIADNNLPLLKSKNDFIELVVILNISNSMAEVEAGRFTCHSNSDLNGTGDLSQETSATFVIGIEQADNLGVWDKFKIYSTGIVPEYIVPDEE